MILRKQPGCWLRSSHPFKECVIAHWSSEVARKITGAKLYTEFADYLTMLTRGRFSFERSENKMPQKVKLYKVDIVRYITVVEEHSMRMKHDRKDVWTK